MSSVFRSAPLASIEAPQGWTLFQKKEGKIFAAWHRKPGQKIQACCDDDAIALVSNTKNSLQKEIPNHWIAIPTGMDLQVHLRFPGQSNKETLEGGLESALLGGYDSILTMPNTNPFLDEPKVLKESISNAQNHSYPVKVAFTASATKGMLGLEATDIQALASAGASAITDDGWGVKSSEAQEAIFAACAQSNLLFQQHAEMPGHKGVAPKSIFQTKESLPEYPRNAESDMIRRDIELLRKHPGARYHVLHVSTKESLAEIRKAKGEGLAISAEVTPHHLIFSHQDIPSSSDPRCTYFKMNPPLFGPEDKAALREALRDGTIDCVSTDHAPHETELKSKGWLMAPFGTRGMETALPALLTLVHEGELTMNRLVEVFSTNPRKLLDKAEFSEPSGLLFVDTTKKYTITETELPGISQNSCFLGSELHGRIEMRCEDSKIFQRKS